jgi:Tfp pilus assembly protein PilO
MKRVLLPILFLGVAVGLYFTYINKVIGEVKALETENGGYDKLLSSAKQIRDRRAELTGQYQQLDAVGLVRMQKMIPDHIDNVRLLIDIDNIASARGLHIRDFIFSGNATGAGAGTQVDDQSSGETASNEAYKTATMTFQVTASYDDLLLFLKDIEQSLRIIDVTKITVNRGEKSSAYTYSITIKTYWLP